MKYLTDRHDIAKVINFGKYPVLYLNRENRPYNTEYAVGCRAHVAWDSMDPRYEGMTTYGNLYIDDNGKLKISGEGGCLHSGFGYHDVIEMYKESQAVVVHRGQAVVVVEDWPSKKNCTVRVMKVSDQINIHCMTVAHLEDLDEDFAV